MLLVKRLRPWKRKLLVLNRRSLMLAAYSFKNRSRSFRHSKMRSSQHAGRSLMLRLTSTVPTNELPLPKSQS